MLTTLHIIDCTMENGNELLLLLYDRCKRLKTFVVQISSFSFDLSLDSGIFGRFFYELCDLEVFDFYGVGNIEEEHMLALCEGFVFARKDFQRKALKEFNFFGGTDWVTLTVYAKILQTIVTETLHLGIHYHSHNDRNFLFSFFQVLLPYNALLPEERMETLKDIIRASFPEETELLPAGWRKLSISWQTGSNTSTPFLPDKHRQFVMFVNELLLIEENFPHLQESMIDERIIDISFTPYPPQHFTSFVN
jgi:hypothetical protein